MAVIPIWRVREPLAGLAGEAKQCPAALQGPSVSQELLRTPLHPPAPAQRAAPCPRVRGARWRLNTGHTEWAAVVGSERLRGVGDQST